MNDVAFSMRNDGQLPVPGWIAAIMVLVFALPLSVIPITLHLLPDSPWLLLVCLGACFPLTVLYLLKRLMTRYAVQVYCDGRVDVVLPFKTLQVRRERLAMLTLRGVRVHVAGSVVTKYWVILADAQGQKLAEFSANAFAAGNIEAFVSTLQRLHPGLVVARD